MAMNYHVICVDRTIGDCKCLGVNCTYIRVEQAARTIVGV